MNTWSLVRLSLLFPKLLSSWSRFSLSQFMFFARVCVQCDTRNLANAMRRKAQKSVNYYTLREIQEKSSNSFFKLCKSKEKL
jgi:hypothetical protein